MSSATTVAETDETGAELEAAFVQHGRELRVLCYRMTGSSVEAEDLTQEAFLRAWRSRHGFRRGASVRTWLYRIATNACLDFLARHERRAAPAASLLEVLEHDGQIDPFPDRYPTSGPVSSDPATVVENEEATDLLLVAALLHLPPRQRAAVIARDFLEMSAAETATLLGSSVPSVNSLLQRARTQLRRHRSTMPAVHRKGDEEQEVVRRYIAAHHQGDARAIVDMLAEDVRVSMPPELPCTGRDDTTAFFEAVVGPTRPGDWQLVPVHANGRPATANYLRRPGESSYRALSIDVLEVREGQLTAVHCFLGDRAFPAFGLSDTRR